MWWQWIWWQMSAEEEWLDEMGQPEYTVWASVNDYYVKRTALYYV
jgi:hypothetical protein